MVFSSHIFLFYFLPLVLLLNYTVAFRFLSPVLMLMSYVFYGWANPVWVLLMLFSSYVDYFCGLVLVRYSSLKWPGGDLPFLPKGEPRRKAQKFALAVSICSNLSILGFFKYYDFGAENMNTLARMFGFSGVNVQLLHIALPAGVSFYTFVSMSYAIDVYRGDARPLKNPVAYQFFVALFPHLIAGPIIRYQTVAEQIRYRTFTYEKFARGVALFSLGMGKKVLLANPLGHIADNLFNAGKLTYYDAWFGLCSYAFQIYFDFSAYSDMAVGLGLMLGFYFMKNFDDPYQAESITDFWHRWHISLSTWLRDYIYIPLGGNRNGEVHTYANLILVMLIGGLWHGASWNFVIWGGIHGTMLALERARGKDSIYRKSPQFVRMAITFLITCVSWVFFRAESLPRSIAYIKALFGIGHITLANKVIVSTVYTPYHVFTFLACIVLVWAAPQAWNFTQKLPPVRAVACLAVFVLSVAMLWTQTVNPFLYFQF